MSICRSVGVVHCENVGINPLSNPRHPVGGIKKGQNDILILHPWALVELCWRMGPILESKILELIFRATNRHLDDHSTVFIVCYIVER
jgi:hypothetical protein